MEYTINSLSFDKLVNTSLFCEAANDYKKNIIRSGGDEVHVYCKAPIGSYEWNEYWDLQELRCAEGFTVGDLKITGRQYYYHNFFPMIQPVVRRSGKTNLNKVYDTGTNFPSFMMIQWLWFTYKHIARYGGDFLGLHSDGGKNMCGLKTRSAGFSYMNASDGCYNFQFKDGSKTFYLAYGSEAITDDVDSTLVKVEAGLDWVNNHTGGVDKNGKIVKSNGQPYGEWRKNRTGSIDEGWIAQWKDRTGYTHGSKSGISPVICNTPRKARGKRGDCIIEEFGSFPNGLDILAILRGNIDMSGVKIAQISAFGTGGEQGPGIQAMETVFLNPEAYDMMEFPNIWEEAQHEKVGFFCPVYFGRLSDCDEDGNPNPAQTIEEEKRIRGQQVDAEKADKRIAEYPFTPSEALKRLTNNRFPQRQIDTQIKLLETNRAMMNRVQKGTLEKNKEGFWRFEPTDLEPVKVFPIISNQKDVNGNPITIDIKGCIEIVQHPVTDEEGNIEDDIYFMTVDCYSVDDVQNVISLYSTTIWKHWNKYDNEFARHPVAWFVGRRDNQEECFEYSLRMCEYYNAKMMGEHNAQGQLLINYIRMKKRIDLLMRESDLYSNRNTKKKVKNFFQNITTDGKKSNIGLLVDLFKEDSGFDEDGNLITWVSECYHIRLLREAKKFTPDRGNFDAISDCSLAPMILKDKIINTDDSEVEDNSDYDESVIDEIEQYTQINNGYVTGY